MDDAQRAELAALLAPEELQRAARFLFAEHANRFVVAHARLRQQLAALLSVAPGDLSLAAGAHGKPAIAGELADAGLEFNLSHSGSLGLVGWSRGRAIGVDIEIWRPLHDEAALVRRYFSASEIAAYELLAPALRTPAFFNCWTRKEAYVKAVGRGLGLPLDSFDVSMGDCARARLLRVSEAADDGRCWSLSAPQLDAGVSAAAVLEGAAFHILPATQSEFAVQKLWT
ncbi:MAG: 4'-phosphopantetheinyl transferase superfamily protein [Steroidobacteraceae bacterium]